ncbi:MAG TPA: flagellar motor protein MotB [Egibacteraceae bacterium]|nr:flagellar motor protein MotB [Egibacteraceae bacterium]
MARGKARGREEHGPKRGGGGGGDGDGGDSRWLTTYGDMVTNLLGFFVILFSMSSVDPARFQSFVEGLYETTFRNESILDGGITIDGELVGPGGEPSGLTPEEQAAEELKVSIEGLRETGAQIEQALQSAGMGGLVDYKIDQRGLVLTIGTDAVLFETGSTELSPQGRDLLAQIAPVLARVPNDIRVEGHTDNVPLNRAGYTNWNLSTDRAVAVLNLLHEVHGVDPVRLLAVGYGEFRPISENETAEGRAANRRVEIIVAVPERRSNVSQ